MAGLGFFKKEVVKQRIPVMKPIGDVPDCQACGLYRTCKWPRMEPTGGGRRGILIVAEGPGEEEDNKGQQLIGPAGQLLEKKLQPYGIDLHQDCYLINAVNCRPPKNRTPERKEIQACRPMVFKAIRDLKPKFIILMGGAALESFFTGKYESDKLQISKWTRFCIPDPDSGAWVMPIFHTSFLLKNSKDKCLDASFDHDLAFVASCLSKAPPEFPDYKARVRKITDFMEVKKALIDVKGRVKRVTFDYETSGKKPYKKGHKIYVVGIATSAMEAFSFPLHYAHFKPEEIQEIEDLLADILTDPNIQKVAHNIKFEDIWTKTILKVMVDGWYWDTILAEHIRDTRRYVSDLKFQTLVRFGVYNYDIKVRKLMEHNDKEGFNLLHTAPLGDLLEYVGLDALFEAMLLENQLPYFRSNGKALDMYNLFHEGALAFASSEPEGIPIKPEFYEEERKRLTTEIGGMDQKILESKEVALFRKKTNRAFSLNSDNDKLALFYDVCQEPVLFKSTKEQRPSLSAEALSKMSNSVANVITRKAKLEKIRDTYIGQVERANIYGKMYPSTDLNTTETGRSSMSDPSFQNFPKRDKAAMNAIRAGIIALPNFRLAELDYKQIEVRIMACYTHDPVLMNYIMDKSTDMHGDQACNCFFLTQEQIKEEEDVRQITKGDFVFAQFYGDYYKQCAANLWEDAKEISLKNGTPLIEHLRNNGIRSLPDYENHIHEVEDHFWNMLRVSRDWRDSIVKFYMKHGYVDTFFGFCRNGYLRRNQIINAPVQGTAFHCLLWAYVILTYIRLQEKWESKMLGQIHDAILQMVHPDEEAHIIKTAVDVMTIQLRQAHPWIIVPIEVDIAMSAVGGAWNKMSKIKIPNS